MTGQDLINYIRKYRLENADILDDLLELPFAVDLPNDYWLKFDPFDDHVMHFGDNENCDFCESISLEDAMKLREEEETNV